MVKAKRTAHASRAGRVGVSAGASGGAGRRYAPWWLHPGVVVLFLGVPLLIAAYLIPESTYLTLYRSEKRVSFEFVAVGLLVYAGLLLAPLLSGRSTGRSQEKDLLLYCRSFIWLLFGFTAFGYVAWFANATIQAGGPGAMLSALLKIVLEPSYGASDYVKFELFRTVPGVTTFTQFGILYATVEALLWAYGVSRRRVALARIALIASLTLPRALLLSERLALVELVIPPIVVLSSVALRSRRTLPRNIVRLAPLFLAAGVFVLFAIAEFFRSWNFYRAIYPGSYLEFAAQRFVGYYATAVNNAAVTWHYQPLQPLRHTLGSLLEFPLLGEAASRTYSAVFGDGYLEGEQLLGTYANYEFNNVALVGLLLNDYSAFLAPVAAFFIGLISMSLYKGFVAGRLVGSLLYPSWFVGLLEVSRLYYWADQRYFPVLGFLAISLLVFRVAKVPVQGKSSASRPPRRARTNARAGA